MHKLFVWAVGIVTLVLIVSAVSAWWPFDRTEVQASPGPFLNDTTTAARGGYACLDDSGKLVQSHLRCTARTYTVCTGVSPEEVQKTLDQALNGDRKVHFVEGNTVYRGDYLLIPDRFLQVTSIYNSSSGYTDDFVRFKDVTTGSEREARATSEGRGDVSYDGVTYTFFYSGASTEPQESRTVRLDYPQTAESDTALDMSLCL